MKVHVINKNGEPLMPCSPRKARLLLKQKKAVPTKGKTGYFTIKLLHGCSGYKQPITVGIDLGAKYVPIAATSGKNVLYAKEKILRTDVKGQLEERAAARRRRRNDTRYRPERFNNRTKQKCNACGENNLPKVWSKTKRTNGRSLKNEAKGRASLCRRCAAEGRKGVGGKKHVLMPSVKNRAESIINDIDKLSYSLPISEVVVETVSFDTQKMANPDIKGLEYQHDTKEGMGLRQYIFTINRHKCVYCGKGISERKKLNIEHIIPISRGGSSLLENLTCACKECNRIKNARTPKEWLDFLLYRKNKGAKLNETEVTWIKNLPKLSSINKVGKTFTYSALSQSYKYYLLDELRERWNTSTTTGVETKWARSQLHLAKSQIIDAIVIASKGEEVEIPNIYLKEKQIKKRYPHDYIGPIKKNVKRHIYPREDEVYGFRLWDRVIANHAKKGRMEGYVTSRRKSGSFAISNLDGELLIGGISYKKLELIRPSLSNYVREWIKA